MSYVLKTSSRNNGRFPLPLKVVLVVIVFLVLMYFIFPRTLSSFFTTLVRPFWNLEKTVMNGEILVSVQDLIKENNDLRNTIAENEARFQTVDLVMSENEELKALLGRLSSTKTILAQILKKPPFSAYDIFILDIGSEHGIVKGNKVLALGGMPIGKISEVTKNTSNVRLYSSAGEKFNVFIGELNVEATATGRGGGTFEATVPRDTRISQGENVTIPSLTNAFVGKVQTIVSDPSHPFSVILFSQPLNLYEMKWVIVDTATYEEN